MHSLAGYWAALGHGIRPLLKLSYTLNWVSGAGAPGFHAFNIAVHLVNTALVVRLYRAAEWREARWPFRKSAPGELIAGALFALHPLQTEAVTYISGRSSSLTALFVLAALLFYAHAARSPSRGALALAIVLFVGAVLTKENAAILPLGLLLWERLIEAERRSRRLLRQAAFWIPLLLLAGLAVMQQSYFDLLYRSAGARSLAESLAYQGEGAFYLLSRLVLVHRLSIDPGLGEHPPSALVLIAAATSIGLLVLLAARCVEKQPIVCFGIAWYLLHVFVPYVFLPRVDVINERHAYLANAGLFLAFAALLRPFAQRFQNATWFRGLTIFAVTMLLMATASRNFDYRSRLALWQSTAHVSPHNPRAHNNLGVAYESAGQNAEARLAYTRALELDPNYVSARRNLERLAFRAPAKSH